LQKDWDKSNIELRTTAGNMKITILQTDIKWADINANIDNAEHLIEEASHSDIYVLPEMWSTGYAIEPQGISEDADNSVSLKWMINIARSLGSAIVGSLSVTESGKYYNRLYFVYPDGNFKYYDKHHLFRLGGENKHYTAGNSRVIVEYKGIRILIATCFDLRFPEWIRNFNDYDFIIIAANWPESRQNAWDVLLKARAIENQCYAIGVNRTGKDKYCNYIGKSAVIDAYGKDIICCPDSENIYMSCDIDIKELQKFRSEFNVLEDRDNYILV
jgi:omega-amidase